MQTQRMITFCMISMLVAAAAMAQYQVGDTVADFTLPNRLGYDTNLYEFQGDVIWLVFWGKD